MNEYLDYMPDHFPTRQLRTWIISWPLHESKQSKPVQCFGCGFVAANHGFLAMLKTLYHYNRTAF